MWDLDDDGAFDDAVGLTASRTFTTAGPKTVRVRVTDPGGLTDTASTVVNVGVAPGRHDHLPYCRDEVGGRRDDHSLRLGDRRRDPPAR